MAIEEAVKYPWRFAVEPFCIAGNLYYVGNANVSAHLIDTGEGLILLDTTFPQTLYLLLESVRRLGFDPHEIAFIVHNHGHYDHFGGTRALVELTGAKTFLGKEDIEIVRRRPELSWAPEYGVEFWETFEVDTALSDGDTICLGSTTIECVHIPGHTPGAMAYFFEVVENGRTYRVGIHGAPGANTLTDEYLRKYDLPVSRRRDFLESLKRLRREKVDIQIGAHPGQNNTLSKAAQKTDSSNPFINPQDWPRFLDEVEQACPSQFDLA